MYRSLVNQIGRPLPRSFARAFALAVVSLSLASGASRAAVTPIGDVQPADDPFTELVDEGLPLGGNFVDTTEDADAQTNWERNEEIIVGEKSFGRLDIDGSSILNFTDLIIGDEGLVGDQTRQGTGFVLITGIGAKYNNDPSILPPGVPDNFGSTGEFARPDDQGFNLYVGRAGVGTLEILGGGRAEIQNVTVIGDELNSTGTVLVDGFASFLQTGGFAESGGPLGQASQMTIARLGTGSMTVSNGGTVLSEVAQVGVSNNAEPTAAVIGGEVFNNTEPEAGGRGTVTVTGPTSTWILGGTLQVGGYHDTGTGSMEVPSGEDALYDSTVGRGTLNVYDGALVTIRPAIDADPEEIDLRLLIGRFGRVNLDNGTIIVGSPGQEMGRQDNIVLSNDGVITGGGRIDTGLFRNRYLGEIRVNAGQSLIFDPTAQINSPVLIDPLNPDSAAQSAGPGVAPAANWGLIDVIGTPEARAELEIERALPTPQRADSVPFWNAALEGEPDPANPIRRVGQITAAHSTLRFRPGLLNQGKLSFIAGDNLVVGQVVNLPRVPLDPSDPVMLPAGEVAVAGNGTTVTFEDHFFNHGVLDVFPNASLILFENDFTQSAAGTTAVTIGGRPTGEEVGFASVLGDLILDGGLDVELFAGSSGAFNPMAGDQYQIMAAAGQVIGQFNQLFLPALPPGLLWGSIDYLGGVTLPIVDGTMIMGADFNGDGVIDDADFAIWLANVGITMGATPAMGDADGDGDVDGDDLLIWQNTMAPGAGSGTIVGTGQGLPGNVPEPASLLLLVSGCTMALALRRRTA